MRALPRRDFLADQLGSSVYELGPLLVRCNMIFVLDVAKLTRVLDI